MALSAYVDDHGASVNSSTDSLSAFTYCLANFDVIRMSAGYYTLSSGITIPPGKLLVGDVFFPDLVNKPGTRLIFPASLATPCVQLTSGGSNQSSGFVNCIVDRASGTIPSGSIGVLVNNGYNPVLSHIGSVGHDVCFKWSTSGVYGIASHVDNLYSATAQDAHWVIDTWPELMANQCRLGANGTIDKNCNAYIRITGGGTGGDGPANIYLNQVQLNQGGTNYPKYALEFYQLTNTSSNALEFKFSQMHIEGLSTAVVYSDSSTAALNRLNITDCTVNTPTVPMFALSASTEPVDIILTGNQLFVSDITLAPTAQLSAVAFIGNVSPAGLNINAPSRSTVTLTGNTWSSATISGAGNFLVMDRYTGTGLTNSATGHVSFVNPDSSLQSWTPALEFGGSATGITYASGLPTGSYQLLGNYVFASFRIILSSKGSGSGVATISGLPYPANLNDGQAGSGVCYSASMSGLSGPITMAVTGGTGNIDLYTGSATGVAALSATNFSNSSVIYGTLVYQI